MFMQTTTSATKINIRANFHHVPEGVIILSEGIEVSVGLIITKGVSVAQFEALTESNRQVGTLWLYRGDMIYTEFSAHRIHNRLVHHFVTLTDTYNRDNNHAVRVMFDSDANVPYSDDTIKAGDIMLTCRERIQRGLKSPNVVGEIGYSSRLDNLVALAPVYLNDSVGKHTELYFIVKIRSPYAISSPADFQMLFLLYDRHNLPNPILVVSNGTIPVSEAVQDELAQLTGVSPLTHPDIHRGHGYGGPACTQENGAHHHYNVSFGGARLVSLNRDGDLPEGAVANPDLYVLDLSLFKLQQAATEAFTDMAALLEGQPAQAQQDLAEALAVAAGEPAPVLTAAELRVKALHLAV